MSQNFDEHNRFVIRDYSNQRPFASFLPGIAGAMGIPLWAFYVNRGQAITSFGIADKDNPLMEFQPANKAYQTTPYTGFRSFIKLRKKKNFIFYEPFAPWNQDISRKMFIGMNELENSGIQHTTQISDQYSLLHPARGDICGSWSVPLH